MPKLIKSSTTMNNYNRYSTNKSWEDDNVINKCIYFLQIQFHSKNVADIYTKNAFSDLNIGYTSENMVVQLYLY